MSLPEEMRKIISLLESEVQPLPDDTHVICYEVEHWKDFSGEEAFNGKLGDFIKENNDYFGDNPQELTRMYSELTTDGFFMLGGGAAGLFKLILSK